MKYDLELVIEENIIVYTRDLTSDYNFTHKNNNLDNLAERHFIELGNDLLHEIPSNQNISSWKIFRQDNGAICVRAIITNETDIFNRIIYRFEGVFLPYTEFFKYSESVIISTLENVLDNSLKSDICSNNCLENEEINPPQLTFIGKIFKDEFGQLWVIKNGDYYKLVDFVGNHLMEEYSLKRLKK